MSETVKPEPVTSCACVRCQNACKYTPGWFTPGEAEKAAKLKGMTLRDFFARYLAVQWWTGETPIYTLAPALVGETPGEMYPNDPRGVCVFFENGRCGIYKARPYECSHGNPCSADERSQDHKYEHVVKPWDKPEHQQQIRELLGREPEPADDDGSFNPFSVFGGF